MLYVTYKCVCVCVRRLLPCPVLLPQVIGLKPMSTKILQKEIPFTLYSIVKTDYLTIFKIITKNRDLY